MVTLISSPFYSARKCLELIWRVLGDIVGLGRCFVNASRAERSGDCTGKGPDLVTWVRSRPVPGARSVAAAAGLSGS